MDVDPTSKIAERFRSLAELLRIGVGQPPKLAPSAKSIMETPVAPPNLAWDYEAISLSEPQSGRQKRPSDPPRSTRHPKYHDGDLTAVAFFDRQLVTASWDKTVRVWDAVNGQQLATLHGHTGVVSSVAVSLDGSLIATGGWDKSVRLWSTAEGFMLTANLTNHFGVVTAVAISPDTSTVASAGWDKSVRLWDIATKREKLCITGHKRMVTGVAFSPDGRRLASASGDNTAILWDTTSGREVARLNGHTADLTSIAFSPTGDFIATGSQDHTAILWDPTTGDAVRTLTGHTGDVMAVAFSPDGQILATAGWDKTIRLWDTTTGTTIQQLRGHTGVISGLSFSPAGDWLGSVSFDRTAKIWNCESGDLVTTLIVQQPMESGVAGESEDDGSRFSCAEQPSAVPQFLSATSSDILTETTTDQESIFSDAEHNLPGHSAQRITTLERGVVPAPLSTRIPKPRPGGSYLSLAVAPNGSLVAAGAGRLDSAVGTRRGPRSGHASRPPSRSRRGRIRARWTHAGIGRPRRRRKTVGCFFGARTVVHARTRRRDHRRRVRTRWQLARHGRHRWDRAILGRRFWQ